VNTAPGLVVIVGFLICTLKLFFHLSALKEKAFRDKAISIGRGQFYKEF